MLILDDDVKVGKNIDLVEDDDDEESGDSMRSKKLLPSVLMGAMQSDARNSFQLSGCQVHTSGALLMDCDGDKLASKFGDNAVRFNRVQNVMDDEDVPMQDNNDLHYSDDDNDNGYGGYEREEDDNNEEVQDNNNAVSSHQYVQVLNNKKAPIQV